MTKRTLDQAHSAVEAAHCYNILLDSREIFVHGETDEWGDMGDSFLKNLRILLSRNAIDPIVIHQHNLGGDWACGMMLRDAIATCPVPIVFICHGIAASMGSIIPMGCHRHKDAYVINMPSADWLLHEGYTDIGGLTMKQARSWAKWEDRITVEMFDWYVEAFKKGSKCEGWSDTRVRNLITKQLQIREDWWLSAREAVEYGLADAVMGDEGFESVETILKHWTTK